MNRLAFGVGVLVLAPLLSGCPNSNFYLTEAPTPMPTATPAPTAIAYPFNPAQGLTGGKGIAQNGTPGLPAAFRVADSEDIRLGTGRAGDPASAQLYLVLQPINPDIPPPTGSSGSASTAPSAAAAPTSGAYVGGVKDVNHPVHVAGIIVPGPTGRVGAGLQDADRQALQRQAYSSMILAVKNWVHLTGTYAETTTVATATPIPTPTATPRPRPGAIVRATPVPTPLPLVDPRQQLDIYQDPQFPYDSENRALVQVFFKSAGSKGIPAGTSLSLNRMLVRSGWAVVDLYSPTSFDQSAWLLDEAYARDRHFGIWGLEINGKKLVLQQRVPSTPVNPNTRSNVPVTNNVPARPGTPIRPSATPITSATQSPTTLTPTLIPPSTSPVIKGSGTSIVRGSSSATVHPLPSAGTAGASPAGGAGSAGGTAPTGGLPSSSGNSATHP